MAIRRARRALSTTLGALAMVALVAACGRTAEVESGPAATAEDAVQVRVQNNLVQPSTVTVFVQDGTGSQELLGTVEDGETATFEFRAFMEAGAGGYRLVAERAGGQDIVSRQIQVQGPATVTWDLSLNDIDVQS